MKLVFLGGILPLKPYKKIDVPGQGGCAEHVKRQSVKSSIVLVSELLDLSKVEAKCATCLLLTSDNDEHCVLNICLGFAFPSTSMIAFDMAADPGTTCMKQCLIMMRTMVAMMNMMLLSLLVM